VDAVAKFSCSMVLRVQLPCSPVTLCRDLRTVQSLPNKTLAASNSQLNAELKIIVVAFLYYELIENLRGIYF
jgi:hypothetical protein